MKFPKLSLPSKFRISLPEKHKEAGTLPGNEAKKKKILRVAIVLMLGVFAGTVYVNEGAKQQASPKAELKQENTAKQDVAESKGSAKNKLHITTDISSQNPFWAKDSEQTESCQKIKSQHLLHLLAEVLLEQLPDCRLSPIISHQQDYRVSHHLMGRIKPGRQLLHQQRYRGFLSGNLPAWPS